MGNLKEAASKMKKRADQHRVDHPFEEGDIVLLMSMVHPTGVAKSFRIHFTGPYLIIQLTGGVTAKILHLKENQEQVVHVHRIKRYFTPEHDLAQVLTKPRPLEVIDIDKRDRRRRGRPRKAVPK